MGSIAADLHCHSSFAGGTLARKMDRESRKATKKIAYERFKQADSLMHLKGIDILGTGDCQFQEWLEIIKEYLEEINNSGIFEFTASEHHVQYILQTELIFTAKIGKRSKQAHIVILFPTITAVEELQQLFIQWEVKAEKMARPFIKCDSPEIVSKRLQQIQDIDPLIEIIPAHIMTPTGVFGSDLRINSLKDFFGDFHSQIHAIETGLSADPLFLRLIPELDSIAMLSNSDAHSPQLHRLGREYTVFSLSSNISYSNLIRAIRNNKIQYTVEFHPMEGRYFLTGHRANRKPPAFHGPDDYCYFSPKHVPPNDLCPICGKKMTIGVFQRLEEIKVAQGAAERNLKNLPNIPTFISMIPLVEIIAHAMTVKNPMAKKVVKIYNLLMDTFKTEKKLWELKIDEILDKIPENIPNNVKKAFIDVKKRNFCFDPPGYDGEYGKLKIGKTLDPTDIAVIHRGTNSTYKQKTLHDF